MRWFDSHAHVDAKAFDEDREQVIQSYLGAGVARVLNPGADFLSSNRAVDLAMAQDSIYAAVGTHPHDATELDQEILDFYRRAAALPKVVAIGEIGLDYYYDHSPRDVQRRAFVDQLTLACQLGLPVIVHSRDAIGETYDILSSFEGKVTGVMHCYSDSPQMAERFLALGWYISLGGPVSFKNARVPKEVAAMVPADRLMIETDSPYLTPHPHRGKRNEPHYVVEVGRAIAEIREVSEEELAEQTWQNACRLFGISHD